jgi:hypothetical protein
MRRSDANKDIEKFEKQTGEDYEEILQTEARELKTYDCETRPRRSYTFWSVEYPNVTKEHF